MKNGKNAIKPSYTQSYPHYPQKRGPKLWNTLLKKRTHVLLINNKNDFLSKKNREKC